MAKRETADEYANRILGAVDLDEPTRDEILDVLYKLVNRSTRTMGQDSAGRDYAHISQNLLDVGRDILKRAGVEKIGERI